MSVYDMQATCLRGFTLLPHCEMASVFCQARPGHAPLTPWRVGNGLSALRLGSC